MDKKDSIPCKRCKDEITLANYGTYVADPGFDLCDKCPPEWLAMSKRHYAEKQAFFNSGG